MQQFKYGTVVYGGIEYARGVVNGRSVLYPLENGQLKHDTKYIYEYRLIYELYNNEKLSSDDIIHHINGDKNDNRPENLVKMKSSEHSRVHGVKRAKNSGYRVGPFLCVDCGKEITHKATRCIECALKSRAKPTRPTKEELENMVKTMSNSEIARKCAVSDTAVRKWRKKFDV